MQGFKEKDYFEKLTGWEKEQKKRIKDGEDATNIAK